MTSAAHRILGRPLTFPRLRFRSLFPPFGLLLLIAIAIAGYVTLRSLQRNDQAVVHTDQVQKELQNLQLQRSLLHDYSSAFFLDHEEAAAADFERAKQTAFQALATLKELTNDNAKEQARLQQIEPLLRLEVAELEVTGNRIQKNRQSSQEGKVRRIDLQVDQISAEIGGEEERLMSIRQSSLQRALLRNVTLLASAVAASMLLLLGNIFTLRQAVHSGELAAEHSRESAESYRVLSGRILAAQDAERRKIGRELHDSVGQQLTGVHMLIEQLAERCDPKDAVLAREALRAIQDTNREVRTISQLLHPPLLDLIGFAAAARSYVEQFGSRSRIKVNADLPEGVTLPSKEARLMLFRILQESLTNVLRHAHATAVDITLAQQQNRIILTIHDNGKGLPQGVLESFKQGVALGVGLAGIRERLAEFGGALELETSSNGTTVQASLPL